MMPLDEYKKSLVADYKSTGKTLNMKDIDSVRDFLAFVAATAHRLSEGIRVQMANVIELTDKLKAQNLEDKYEPEDIPATPKGAHVDEGDELFFNSK